MDSLNMIVWLRKPRVIKPLQNGKIRDLFIDNCSGNNLTKDILGSAEAIRTNLHLFPPNTTELVQPCDAIVIQKIKAAWKKRWKSVEKTNSVNLSGPMGGKGGATETC